MAHPTISWLISPLSFPMFYLSPMSCPCVLPPFLLPPSLCHATQAVCLFYPLATHTPTVHFPLPLVSSSPSSVHELALCPMLIHSLHSCDCVKCVHTHVHIWGVCMFVCVPVHMCVSKHACGGQKSASSVIPQDPFTFIKNDSLLCVHEDTLVCIVWRSEDNLQFTLSFLLCGSQRSDSYCSA